MANSVKREIRTMRDVAVMHRKKLGSERLASMIGTTRYLVTRLRGDVVAVPE